MLLVHFIRQYYSQLTAGDTFVAVMCINEQSSTLILTAMLLFSTSTGESATNYHDCSHRRRTPVEFGDPLTFHLVPPAGQIYRHKISHVEKVDCHIKHLLYGLSDKRHYSITATLRAAREALNLQSCFSMHEHTCYRRKMLEVLSWVTKYNCAVHQELFNDTAQSRKPTKTMTFQLRASTPDGNFFELKRMQVSAPLVRAPINQGHLLLLHRRQASLSCLDTV